MNSCLHNLHHLLDDQFLVGGFGIAGGLYLLLGSLGEGNGEQSQDESISGLCLHVGFDHGVPLSDHGACFISGNVHSVEVGVAIVTLDFINLELELSP